MRMVLDNGGGQSAFVVAAARQQQSMGAVAVAAMDNGKAAVW